MDSAMHPAQKSKPLTVRRSGVGTGTTSLLMIFTVLCFATLAMLSLSTAVSSMRIQDRGVATSQAFARARGAAAEAVAALDGELYALRAEAPDESAYLAAAHEAAAARGWVRDEAAGTITLATEADSQTRLNTTLAILPPAGPDRYTVVGQTIELVDGWNPEGGAGLLLP